jgi:hypothetical protein
MAAAAPNSPSAAVVHAGHPPLEGVQKEGHAGDGKAPGDEGSDTDVGEVDATALEDAEGEDESITDSHYQRGKRFRRLHRLMSSPLVSFRIPCGLHSTYQWLAGNAYAAAKAYMLASHKQPS